MSLQKLLNRIEEIIETYWNVNKKREGLSIPFRDRNNRNILECKFEGKKE